MSALVLALSSISASAPTGGGDARVPVLAGDFSEAAQLSRVTRRGEAEVASLRHSVVIRRTKTWEHQDAIDRPRTKTAYAERRTRSVPFLGWIRALWSTRAHKAWQLKVRLETDAETAIRFVFGPYADQAIAVARCESGFSRHAHNGQYLGLFQMGSSERATYGHGDTFLEQARAAHRYFVASGRDWSPWSCKPWGVAW